MLHFLVFLPHFDKSTSRAPPIRVIPFPGGLTCPPRRTRIGSMPQHPPQRARMHPASHGNAGGIRGFHLSYYMLIIYGLYVVSPPPFRPVFRRKIRPPPPVGRRILHCMVPDSPVPYSPRAQPCTRMQKSFSAPHRSAIPAVRVAQSQHVIVL